MQVTYLSTNNEKFAYAYAIEKGIKYCEGIIVIYVYDRVEEMTRKLGELRWLLVSADREKQINIEDINRRVQFRVIDSVEEAVMVVGLKEVDRVDLEFHIFPSKKLSKLADYVKFILTFQSRNFKSNSQIVIIDHLKKDFELIYTMFPPQSILTVSSYPASKQFEIQKLSDRGIVESIKMDRDNDRMHF